MVSWETYFPIYFFAYSSEKNLQKKMLFFAIEVLLILHLMYNGMLYKKVLRHM